MNNVNYTPTPAPAGLADTGHGVPVWIIIASLIAMLGAGMRFRKFQA